MAASDREDRGYVVIGCGLVGVDPPARAVVLSYEDKTMMGALFSHPVVPGCMCSVIFAGIVADR